MKKTILAIVFLALASCCSPTGRGDSFGSGANSFEIEFVTIGDPGNLPDQTDRAVSDGAVPYSYRIGKYEISEQMIEKANATGGLGISKDLRGPEFPATSISWFEAAKFVNWLNTSAGNTPAYKFDAGGNFQLWVPTDSGYDAGNLYRNSLARYFLPTLSEWHKAAYYDPVASTYYDYPTGSDSVPDGIDFAGDPVFDAVFFDGESNGGPNEITNVGLLSPYKTFAQGGNVSEWLETTFDRINNSAGENRQTRGGSWNFPASLLLAANGGLGWLPSTQLDWMGLRVATIIPEPSTFLSSAMALLILLASGIRRRKGAQR